MTAHRAQAGVGRRRAWLVSAVAILTGVDLAVKAWAKWMLADGRSFDLALLQLRLGSNPGVAFGLGANLPGWVVVGVTGLIVVGLAVAAWQWVRTGRTAVRVGLSLVLSGAVANLIDRAADGVVTDYLHTGWWPTFNLADILITGGVAVLLLAGHTHPQRRSPGTGAVTRQSEQPPGRRGPVLMGFVAAGHIIVAMIAVTAAAAADSTALAGLGIAAGLSVFAVGVALWHPRSGAHRPLRPVQRVIAIAYYALAAYLAVEAIRDLITGDQPGASPIGIVLNLIALMVLPPIALALLRTSHATNTPGLEAQATQTWKSTALSAVVLVGLVLNAALGWWWSDPAAALIIAALAVHSGRQAWSEAGELSTPENHRHTSQRH